MKDNTEAEPFARPDTARAINEAVDFLSKNRFLHDLKAGENGLRFQYMCGTGLVISQDERLKPDDRYHFTGEHPEEIVARAKTGDRVAHDALCAVADHLTARGEPLPLELQRYVVGAAVVPPKWKKGRNPVSNIYRDDAIFRAVELVVGQGFNATKNDSSEHESACSIVAKALAQIGSAMSEDNVETIWSNRCKAMEKAGFRTSRKPDNPPDIRVLKKSSIC